MINQEGSKSSPRKLRVASCLFPVLVLSIQACGRSERELPSPLMTEYSPDEIAVYLAVLDHISRDEDTQPFMLPDTTLNYGEIAGCMAKYLPSSLEQSTRDDYSLKNKHSYVLPDICSKNNRCTMEEMPEANRIFFGNGRESIDLSNQLIDRYKALNILVLSRPGLNSAKDQALVYCYFIGLGSRDGSYVMLLKEGGKWIVRDRTTHKSALINLGYLDD